MNAKKPYETLDPENWDEMRALAHRMVDDAITYLETVRERPVWQTIPEEITARLEEPAPRAPGGADAAYQEFSETILPYPMGNIHPRFWGWYMGAGTVFGALADFMAPIGMDIVCFRFNPGGMGDAALNVLNKEILMRLHESGIAAPSYTTLNDQYCLRIAIANHRSTQDDFDMLAKEVVRIGNEVIASA